ncbi:MAG: helix-turn-helix domain-containing protein [Clostridia bacterium]|nr:helix-turn-helix domain-containing protein [Clostridia bacterium]
MKREEEHFCRFLASRHIRAGCYSAGTNVGFPSPHLAYIIRGECRAEYDGGKVIRLCPGDVWFIPKGLPYASHWTTEDDVIFDRLEFEADDFSLKYRSMQAIGLPGLKDDFGELCEAQNEVGSFGSIAAFYRILSAISPFLQKEENASLDRILPALKYLRQWNSASVRVEELAAMCYMSPSRFYEVFREAVGESPINYKNRIRLSHARMLMQEGKKLEEICEMLHFSSPSFLRRMMKKHLDTTPKEIKQGRSI